MLIERAAVHLIIDPSILANYLHLIYGLERIDRYGKLGGRQYLVKLSLRRDYLGGRSLYRNDLIHLGQSTARSELDRLHEILVEVDGGGLILLM